MHLQIPFSALLAEAQAFPLVSPQAFFSALTTLAREAPAVPVGATSTLSTALVQTLLPKLGGLSLDVLSGIRDQAWFPAAPLGAGDDPMQAPRAIPLFDYLRALACQSLEWAGGRVRLRQDSRMPYGSERAADTASCAEHWRWLSLFLPADLLIAALTTLTPELEPPIEHVQLVTPHLREVLRKPCAETHLHLGSALPFSVLWQEVMVAVQHRDALPLRKLHPPFMLMADEAGGSPEEHAALGAWSELLLLCAAITRVILMAFLWRVEKGRIPARFARFVDGEGPHDLRAICSQIPQPLQPRQSWEEQAFLLCRALLDQLYAPARPAPKTAAQSIYERCGRARWLYRELQGTSQARPAHPDPLQTWLPPEPGQPLSETRFCTRALRYLESRRFDDPRSEVDQDFAILFFQYQRIRIQLYRYLVQTPGVAGLDWFTRFYDRIWPLREPLRHGLVTQALTVESRDLRLGSLEVRQSPLRDWRRLRQRLGELVSQALEHPTAAGTPRPEVGLVLHFVKAKYFNSGGVTRLHADPSAAPLLHGCRHGAWYAEREAEATAIAKLLENHPESLLVLRGLDVANTELAQPTWLLVPLFERVRWAAKLASAKLAARYPTWSVPPLRTTLHAGEDFVRLSEGIRRIHEPIECGLLELGDRLGHGLAMGIEPRRWAQHAPLINQPREDRLDDLLWEYERYQRADLPIIAQRIEYVRAEIMRLGRLIYADSEVTLDALLGARRLRFLSRALGELGFPSMVRAPRRRAARPGEQELLHRYLTDRGVFVRGQQSESVLCDPSEILFLEAAQTFLRRELGRLEITVESNPSSNLLIGGFAAIESLPVFRMQPLELTPAAKNDAVLISLNTDNPVTFSSCLADEISYVYYGLLRHGISATDALAWIERARTAGWRSRFTLSASAARENLQLLQRTLR